MLKEYKLLYNSLIKYENNGMKITESSSKTNEAKETMLLINRITIKGLKISAVSINQLRKTKKTFQRKYFSKITISSSYSLVVLPKQINFTINRSSFLSLSEWLNFWAKCWNILWKASWCKHMEMYGRRIVPLNTK